MAPLLFHDRADAGVQLATQLKAYANRADVVVVGLPRGGVPVAYEVARALHAPLEVCVVRKLGVPGQEELAMGAIADDIRYLNRAIVKRCQVSSLAIEQVTQKEHRELERRERDYRPAGLPLNLCDRTVILVDDGLATGATMIAAAAAIKPQLPSAIIVAVPVAAPETCQLLSRRVDTVVSVKKPEVLRAIGLWYENFSQTTDEEVRELLHRASLANNSGAAGAPGDRPSP